MANDNFSNSILVWFAKNHRNLPWRNTKDPYVIWLSEIILQQTRVAQGLPYFRKFVSKFPTVVELAKAKEEVVLKMWQGLGYYSRARNMLKTAKQVVESGDPFPSTYNKLIELKGVGEYTASAIASFSSNERVAVVDGNVYRVLSRHYGITEPIDSTRGKKTFKEIATSLLPYKNADMYNQAIMEFGALQCKPKNPNCSSCTVSLNCAALSSGKVGELPIKAKKLKKKKIQLQYVVLKYDSEILIRRRIGLGVWEGLYDFPSIESKTTVSSKKILEKAQSFANDKDLEVVKTTKIFKHVLSHIEYNAHFWEAVLSEKPTTLTPHHHWVKNEDIENYPVSRLVEKFLEG